MSTTFDDIRELFRETDRKFQETDRKLQEAALQAEARAEARAAEFTAQLRESSRQAEERAAERSAEFARQAAERAAEAAKRTAELEQLSKLTGERVSEVTRQIGRLGNRLGDWVESMVRPACVSLFQERNIEVHEVSANVYVKRHGEAMEIDLLVVNEGSAVLVECKSQVLAADISEHLARMEKVKRLMPQYANYTLYGAIAGMSISESVQLQAEQQGFFVITPNGENVMIANPPGFVAKAW